MKKRNDRLSLSVYLVLAGLVYLISAVLIGIYLFHAEDPVISLPGMDPVESSEREDSGENIPEEADSSTAGNENETSDAETIVEPEQEGTVIPLEITGDSVLTEENRAEVERLTAELEKILQEDAPSRIQENEDGSQMQGKGKVTFAYRDLKSGFGMSYGGDEIRYSASLIKAFYLYAVLKEIEDFEEDRARFADDGSPLYDEDGQPLFEGAHPNYNEDGTIRYPEEKKHYNLREIWEYDPETMFEEGSGEIQNHTGAPLRMTWLELMEYALKYSDNIAYEQFTDRFGYQVFYDLAHRLGLQGTSEGIMRLTASDGILFLDELYGYLETDSPYAAVMKEAMRTSYHLELICRYFYQTTTAIHKYGWDKGAFHDMALIFGDRPLAIVLLSDYEDGGAIPTAYFGRIVELTKTIHETVGNSLLEESETEGSEIIEEILPSKTE